MRRPCGPVCDLCWKRYVKRKCVLSCGFDLWMSFGADWFKSAIFYWFFVYAFLFWACAKSLQSCLSLFTSMDCSSPGSSVHGILQARILEWVATPSSGDLPDPGMELMSYVSCATQAALPFLRQMVRWSISIWIWIFYVFFFVISVHLCFYTFEAILLSIYTFGILWNVYEGRLPWGGWTQGSDWYLLSVNVTGLVLPLPSCLFSFCRIKTRRFPRLGFFPQIRQIQNSKTTNGQGNQGKRSLGLHGRGSF